MANLGDVGLVINRQRAQTFPFTSFTVGVQDITVKQKTNTSTQFNTVNNTIIINNGRPNSVIDLYQNDVLIDRRISDDNGTVTFYDLENTNFFKFYASDISSANKWEIIMNNNVSTINKLNSGIFSYFSFG